MQLGLPFTSPHETDSSLGAGAPGTATPEWRFIRHRRARRYVVRVDPDGRVRVTIPRGGWKREADAFARRHLEWIRQQQSKARARTMPPEKQHLLRTMAKESLPARFRELATEHGLDVARVSVRNQRSRWGSCGHDGHICLNWRLVLMPDWVRDYVMIHELMHLKLMNHSPAYWRLVRAACPNYVRARKWLRDHARTMA